MGSRKTESAARLWGIEHATKWAGNSLSSTAEFRYDGSIVPCSETDDNMAHRKQRVFCHSVKLRFPAHFRGCKVLDVGSLDINGSNRGLFEKCEYVGLDLEPGRNVTVVNRVHEYRPDDGLFDTVISTEMLEHDIHYEQSIAAMIRLVRPGGLLIVTCATTGRPTHGTRRNSPKSSPFTVKIAGWCDHYRNLTEADFRTAVDVESTFDISAFEIDRVAHDLRFWGIKRNSP